MNALFDIIITIIEMVMDVFGILVAFFLGSGILGFILLYSIAKYFIGRARDKNAVKEINRRFNDSSTNQNKKERPHQKQAYTAATKREQDARQKLAAKLEKIRQEAKKYIEDEEEVTSASDVEILTPPEKELQASLESTPEKVEDISLNRRLRDYKLKKHDEEIKALFENEDEQKTLEVEIISDDQQSLRADLTHPESLAEAFILKEILDKPVALRKN